DSDDRKCLIKIARGEQPDLSNEAPALNSLRNNSLIRDDLAKRKWFIFSHLFQDYIIRQSGSAASEDIEYILEDLAPLERNLFLYLSERPNRICGTEELKRIFWDGLDSNKQKRGLEAAIHRIRSSARYKSSGWNYLRNERGIGFIFVPKSE
ncbi:MAG: helix-turn-helix domain-containing protein, partial [Sulfurimonas sp.]|nr:helix-turn-helix domain-containing protein [Sulfurimonas sp.]